MNLPFEFLLQSGVQTVALGIGAFCVIVAIAGKLGDILDIHGWQRVGMGAFGALLITLGLIPTLARPTEVRAPTATPSQPVQSSPTQKPDTPTPWVTRTGATPVSSISPETASNCQGRLRPQLPCKWTVEGNDSFESIATASYGDRRQMLILVNLNRDTQGYRRTLKAGDDVLVPDLANIPDLPYPSCEDGDTGAIKLPCIHHAFEGETYSILARRYYRQQSFASCMRSANFGFDGVYITLIGETVDDDLGGYEIVVPVPRTPCQ